MKSSGDRVESSCGVTIRGGRKVARLLERSGDYFCDEKFCGVLALDLILITTRTLDLTTTASDVWWR